MVGDGLTIDHIPSNASNIARAESELGGQLSKAKRAAVRDQGMAVAVPEDLRRSASPTYGGRNTPAQIASDAANPKAAAAARDTSAMSMLQGLLTNRQLKLPLTSYQKNPNEYVEIRIRQTSRAAASFRE